LALRANQLSSLISSYPEINDKAIDTFFRFVCDSLFVRAVCEVGSKKTKKRLDKLEKCLLMKKFE